MFIVYMAQSAYLLKDMVSDQTLWEWCYSGKSNTDTNVYNRLAEVIGNCFDCYDIYLQGSYRNSTSIDGNGDVDIVVECNGYYENAYISRHDLKHLRDDLFEAIQGYHNFRFEKGSKTIKYPGSYIYSPADIVPCIPYDHMGNRGISIYDHRKHKVIHNYPKQHMENGTEKNKRTNQLFKKTVRVFKNARDYLVEHYKISGSTAPSYFIECMVYNVPDYQFVDDIPTTVRNVLRWLNSNFIQAIGFRCQNEITYMFDVFDPDTGWDYSNFNKFLTALNDIVRP